MAYVKADVIAEQMGVSRQTIWAWSREDPDFPVYNIGTEDRPNYRYVIEEVKNYKMKGRRS